MSLQRNILFGEIDQVLRDVVLNRFVASGAVPRKLRNVLLRRAGHDIHPTSLINAGVFLGAWRGLDLGERAFVNYGCFFDLGSEVTIGRDTRIGYQSMFITCGHKIGGEFDRAGKTENLPIVIGAGCWIGARVTVLPGVSIGDGCVIASGSVVAADCVPNGFYAGVPAVRKRCLPTDLDPKQI
ncbi:acyltransferase [Rhodococcoides fascians A21d2]|uniref:acyltransferase n=1 Tax=Rhodococcoides fascians TaxID=1828 RepID=UPI00056279E0|nr:acyltransferase [Rhodococcus fascians]QIH99448.1 acyltransferase [Rhodococcus fascians A21d2]